MAKNKGIQNIQDLAEKLHGLRQQINDKEEANKKDLETLKIARDTAQQQLLEKLNENGISSLKVSNGDSFFKGTRKSVEVVSEIYARKWVKENDCFSVDKTLVMQKLKELPEVPKCFDVIETEFISVRKSKE